MTKEEILKLINAGYTKADIDAMGEPQPEPQPEAEPQPQPDPEPQPEPQPESVSLTADAVKEFTSTVKELSELIKKQNIINDGHEPKTALERGEEVLASLINPPEQKKKK